MPVISNELWQQIRQEAAQSGVPSTKKRGIIREYLQSQILYHLYNLKNSRYLIFIGGTALRFLYRNQRLSEDLDFNLAKRGLPLNDVLAAVHRKLNFPHHSAVEMRYRSKADGGGTAYFKYRSLLYELKISSHPEEKLVIKFDFSLPEDKLTPESKIFSKFGFMQNVLTYDRQTLLGCKTRALFGRRAERGRDLYDIAKLRAFNIEPNYKMNFFQKRKINSNEEYLNLLAAWYRDHKKIMPKLKIQLKPFLIDEEEISYLDRFFIQ